MHASNLPNITGFDNALILVVDDDPLVRESILDILHFSGFKALLQASNGSEALDVLEHQTPDLIISDIVMPGMNGYQFYLRVHRNPAWLHIPFIFLTSKGQTEDIRYAKEMGIDDYLTKPVTSDDLVAAIRGKLLRFTQLMITEDDRPDYRPTGLYQVDRLLIDLDRMQVMVGEQEVKLSSTEFAILQRLVLAGGAAVDYEDLLGYDEDQPLGDNDAAQLLRYHIRNLRRKLEEAGVSGDLIASVRSVGYRLNADVVSR
ncbi:MAG: response regulator transcription factor [Anaerolineae bacterium]|nr:response regulator transcription factor [Anaerolineae bacterium]